MKNSLFPELYSLFEDYKLTESYQNRLKQFAFAPLAKEIIHETLKNQQLLNEHLTGFIQMFKWETSNDAFDRYLKLNIPDKAAHDRLSEQAYKIEEYGYTAAGKTSINGLDASQLKAVQDFLLSSFDVKEVEDAVALTEKFDSLGVPEVKHGVYSPWLHYINPAVFPIINNTHIPFLDWLEIQKKYHECIIAFHELKELTNETQLGMLDGFSHAFVNNTVRTRFGKFTARYKELIRADHNANEIYKWECVANFQKHFNLNAPDFERMLKNSINKSNNLVFQNSLGFIMRAAKHFPEETRKLFRLLFTEEIDLSERINQFKEEAVKMLPSVISQHGKEMQHQQDERTISFYLAMRYPENYILYKDDIYKLLLTTFPNEAPAKAGGKYLHFLGLADIVIPVLEKDEELLKLSAATLTEESYKGDQLGWIFQDILWRNKNKESDVKQYFLLGASWDDVDQTQRFKEAGNWENGHDEKFLKEAQSIQPGSRVAIKAAHTVEKTKSVMTIKAIGTVTENFDDGKLAVDWDAGVKPFRVDFSGGYWGTVHEVKNQSHIDAIFFHSISQSAPVMNTTVYNLILFGPPGTGKTYHSIDKAVEIASGKSFGDHRANKTEFDRLRNAGQIEFVTFHQNYSYEDFMVGITPDTSATPLRFTEKEGIFKQLSDRAKSNWLKSRNSTAAVQINFEHVFNAFFADLTEEVVREVDIPMKSKGYNFKITKIDYDQGRIKFTKKSGGTGHDLLIKNIKGIYEGTHNYGQEGLGVYYYPLDEKLKEFAITHAAKEPEKEVLKKYVLVIDEINRANISKVFGELITLLEDDKRLGEENELKVSLPNGEKDFGVPPNLYIVGTMNTADKSIALVDIALRRRFEFIGKYPEYQDLEKSQADFLQAVNHAIYNEKPSADYLIGHAYFMKGQPLEDVVRSRVIPLLMEYFSGRTETVTKILANTNLAVSYNRLTHGWDIQPKQA